MADTDAAAQHLLEVDGQHEEEADADQEGREGRLMPRTPATTTPLVEPWKLASADIWLHMFHAVRAAHPDMPLAAVVAATDYAVKKYA
jgi:hypothetical protein